MGTMTTGWTYGFIKPESLDKVIAQSKEFFEAEVKDYRIQRIQFQ